MTTYTKSDLATRILRDAGLVGADETPSAVDLLYAEETLSSEIDAMALTGVVIWDGSEISIPNSYLSSLSRRLVLPLGLAFGLYTAVEVEQGIPLAEKTLRKMSAIPGTGTVLETDYF